MANNLMALLKEWYPLRDSAEWVLATIYQTEGPSYRKAGSMMLFSDEGHQLGMLSGGCLESDISKNARRVMASGQASILLYDGQDEDDLSFHLGIGCGGTVWIMLQPVDEQHGYLALDDLYQTLQRGDSGHYYQRIPSEVVEAEARFIPVSGRLSGNPESLRSKIENEGDAAWLHTPIQLPHHLLIAGGGMDARPLITLAHHLGWQTSIWDPRPANGRPEHFPLADHLIKGEADHLQAFVEQHRVNAAVVMSHHVELDAKAIAALNSQGLSHMALLGPMHRKARVLQEAGLTDADCSPALAGPAGLDLGGELPETIALAILAECQASLSARSGRSLSGLLNP